MGPLMLTLAAVLASAAGVSAFLKPDWHVVIQRVAIACLWLAAGHVMWLLIREDTSYEIVVSSTRPGLSPIRRAMGLWGTSSGSLLFFGLVFGSVLIAAPVVDRLRAAPALVLATLTWTSVLAESPFTRLDTPAIAGSGLSPILEHWAMIIHPPMLYLGLALSLVPAIVRPEVSRVFSSAAIVILTIALALGGGWAYEELGWGGWYAWDPVENVALIPWLLLVAAFHLRPQHLASRYVLLLVWPTVFAGTAMTRTSLRTSVHAFANNDQLGLLLWPLAVVVSIGALVFAFSIRNEGSLILPMRRRWPFGLVAFSAVVVALGTFRPFVPGDGTAGTFYTRYLYPVVIIGLIAMGLVPNWSEATKRTLTALFAAGAVVGAAAAVLSGWATWWQIGLAAALVGAITSTVGLGVKPLPKTLAHLGLICVLAGALGGTASTTRNFLMDPGESRTVEGHTISNEGVSFEPGPPFVITADILIDSSPYQPQITVFPERQLRLPEVATHRRLAEDVQVILRSADDDGSVQITVNVQPLTQFVWIGTALIAASFILIMAQRRRVKPEAAPVEPLITADPT